MIEDEGYKLYNGDCLEILKTLSANSVQSVVTSPPYFALRDYHTAKWIGGDPQCNHLASPRGGRNPETSSKQLTSGGTLNYQYAGVCNKCGATNVDHQLGLESSPDCLGWATGNPCGACYVCRIASIFREIWRILRDDGTLWLVMGDTYAGGHWGDQKAREESRPSSADTNGWTNGFNMNARPQFDNLRRAGLKPKNLIGIPWRVAFALQADGWWLRSDIIWNKPNILPESVTDRPTKAHEHIFLFAKSPKYYYDHVAIREIQSIESIKCLQRGISDHHKNIDGAPGQKPHTLNKPRQNANSFRRSGNKRSQSVVPGKPASHREDREDIQYSGSRNKRSVWTVATPKYSSSHFATFPPKLIEPCILAGASPHACEHCGSPWKRMIEKHATGKIHSANHINGWGLSCDSVEGNTQNRSEWREGIYYQTVGWQPTCDCLNNTGIGKCIVLDPFSGSGTTIAVALQYGRSAIGIELNPDYIELTRERIAKVQLAMPNLT